MPHPAKGRVKQQRDKQYPVVERKNAQRAANVKVAEAVWGVARVVQNAGNEETGQNEEDIYSSPAPCKRRLRAQIVMCVEDHEHRKRTQAVQRRVERLVLGGRQPRNQIRGVEPGSLTLLGGVSPSNSFGREGMRQT